MGKRKIVLITGACRSGKSRRALELVASDPSRVFIATAEALDDEMQEKIKEHRAQRGKDWITVEEPIEISRCLREHPGSVVVIDCITLWITNLLSRHYSEEKIQELIATLIAQLKRRESTTIIVTNETGWGVIPDNPMARWFNNLLGAANQKIAEAATEVILMIAGFPIYVKT